MTFASIMLKRARDKRRDNDMQKAYVFNYEPISRSAAERRTVGWVRLILHNS